MLPVADFAPPAAEPDLNIDDEILVRHSDHTWYAAVVVRKRSREDGQTEVQYRWAVRKTARENAWKLASDPTIHVPNNENADWDENADYEAERLLAERGEGEEKEYLVRCAEFSSACDSWEPVDHIIDPQLVQDFEEEKARNQGCSGGAGSTRCEHGSSAAGSTRARAIREELYRHGARQNAGRAAAPGAHGARGRAHALVAGRAL